MTDQLYMTMNDGHNIPVVGLGTWKSEPGDSTYNAVFDSIKAGYRHIDTARAYDNESDVGRAINAADVPRENLFITTKLSLLSIIWSSFDFTISFDGINLIFFC